MKNRDLKKQLIKESQSFVPDIKDRIYASVGYSTQKKLKQQYKIGLKPVLALLVLLVASLTFFVKPAVSANTFIIMEINPAIELELDQDNIVVNVNSLNTDGYFFLESLQINNLSIDEALVKIIDEATLKGFLQTQTSMITVSAVNQNKRLEANVNELVKNIIEKHKPGVINPNNELIEEAKEYNISSGRMLIIKRAIEADSNLTIGSALKMGVNDLIFIINSKAKAKVDKFENEYKDNLDKYASNYNRNIEELERRKEATEARLEELEDKISSGISVNEFLGFAIIHFPEYKIDKVDDLEEALEEIDEFYDDHYNFLEEIVEESYENHKEAYRNKVNENSKNNKDDFSFEFDEDFWFNNYHNRYSVNEKQIIKIINQIIALMENRSPGGNRRITDLYEDYIDELKDASADFINSEIVLNFELAYNKYLNEVKAGHK